MHPHLVGEQKKEHCAKYIQALEECHRRGLLHKLTGGCNGVKHELNMCLREERLARTAKHIQDSKELNEKKRKIWKAIEEES
ncbi:UPF0287-domain-containing protein [Violaceomyces palustris]|uniref:UPF0287-domain-containing protein n=1 Tax=Violaceomyces palustris TaxID=1673888 RepID=A0ACD0P5D1_9BASI|nr:UPF0287-domain-containing protein [Violaceomyces palustris]